MKPLMIRMNWTELPSPQKARKSVFVGLCGFVWVCVRVRVCVWERERGEREKKKHFNKVKLSNKIIEWNLIGPIVFHSWIFMFLSSEKKIELETNVDISFRPIFFTSRYFFQVFLDPDQIRLRTGFKLGRAHGFSIISIFWILVHKSVYWYMLVHTGAYWWIRLLPMTN